MRNTPRELAGFVSLIYQTPPPPSLSPPPLQPDILRLSRTPFALFLSSQGKSSYLNWPQESLLSDFNAPYSVDSISITPVTKD